MNIKLLVSGSLVVAILIFLFIFIFSFLVSDKNLDNLNSETTTVPEENKSDDILPITNDTIDESEPNLACGAGGACTLEEDVKPYNTKSDCRIAINTGVSSQPSVGIYKIPSSFLSTHSSNKNIASYCGKVLNYNLKNAVNNHNNGSLLEGSSFDQWIKSFYFGSL